ncbi:hypothetical protein NPIL_574621 [Nephila pilipes]|uniref:Uncharacterized protein n=1 Tax=Nephila pilipes TaxID=299642 RepID=A0A8X6TBV2_NEPPI|nr:hypothetical protein NPIL_574621 [Nephila pilipes]
MGEICNPAEMKENFWGEKSFGGSVDMRNVNSPGNALSSILTHRFCSAPEETIHFIQNEIKTNHVGRNGSDACRFPGYDAVSRRRQCDF